MDTKSIFKSVSPIGKTDPTNLPVRDLEKAIDFYQTKLGFTLQSQAVTPCRSAKLCRDGVVIGLAENGGDPEQASCYMDVSHVDLAFQEFSEKGLDVSPIRVDRYGDKSYHVFFVRDPDGLCYCIGQPE